MIYSQLHKNKMADKYVHNLQDFINDNDSLKKAFKCGFDEAIYNIDILVETLQLIADSKDNNSNRAEHALAEFLGRLSNE